MAVTPYPWHRVACATLCYKRQRACRAALETGRNSCVEKNHHGAKHKTVPSRRWTSDQSHTDWAIIVSYSSYSSSSMSQRTNRGKDGTPGGRAGGRAVERRTPEIEGQEQQPHFCRRTCGLTGRWISILSEICRVHVHGNSTTKTRYIEIGKHEWLRNGGAAKTACTW